jgi:hypothetical protein
MSNLNRMACACSPKTRYRRSPPMSALPRERLRTTFLFRTIVTAAAAMCASCVAGESQARFVVLSR